ncbi:hypothetical protein Strain138_002871 [Pseudogemmatithrix spongiicola]|uniref:Lipoprotein n=1 Tax=Pseudogemmatithrix spongiicola TaxID=3062599 RepID=A0AA49JXD0_9BACT|nr:hypothetical protein Strain138_002871 [Gemmatimonadaceae bacterium 'strain 138']WKW16453.1 hypothetical protein Strain318_002869 [Gemmatimonadaceae bacterium 'strain 318']
MNPSASSRAAAGALLSLAGLAGLACTEPFSPRPLAGLYAMVALNDVAPPRTLAPNFVVVADTLQLGVDGRGTWTSVRDTTPAGAAPLPLATQSIVVRVAHRNGTTWLDFVDQCTGVQDCVARYPLTAVADGLIVDVDPAIFRFLRVAP